MSVFPSDCRNKLKVGKKVTKAIFNVCGQRKCKCVLLAEALNKCIVNIKFNKVLARMHLSTIRKENSSQ